MIMYKKQPKVHASYKYHKSIVQLVDWLLTQICNYYSRYCLKFEVFNLRVYTVMASVTSGFGLLYWLWHSHCSFLHP